MKEILFKGCGSAICTPFINNEINFTELESFIEFQIKNNINSLIISSPLGEDHTLSLGEKILLAEFVLDKVNNRIPVIFYFSTFITEKELDILNFISDLGINGFLIPIPKYINYKDEDIIYYYSTIAQNISKPIIISDNNDNVSPFTYFELSRLDNIVGIEFSSFTNNILEISNLCQNTLSLYSGNDCINLPILSIGGIGCISTISNVIPNYMSNLILTSLNGDFKTSSNLNLKVNELQTILSTHNSVSILKSMLNFLDFNFGKPKFPSKLLSKEQSFELITKLEFLLNTK